MSPPRPRSRRRTPTSNLGAVARREITPGEIVVLRNYGVNVRPGARPRIDPNRFCHFQAPTTQAERNTSSYVVTYTTGINKIH